jgi:hypothetical protein
MQESVLTLRPTALATSGRGSRLGSPTTTMALVDDTEVFFVVRCGVAIGSFVSAAATVVFTVFFDMAVVFTLRSNDDSAHMVRRSGVSSVHVVH